MVTMPNMYPTSSRRRRRTGASALVAAATLLSNISSGVGIAHPAGDGASAPPPPLNETAGASSSPIGANPLALHSASGRGAPRLLGGDGRHGGRTLKEDDIQVDLSSHSLRFERCQYVKMYDDELAAQAGEDYDGEGYEEDQGGGSYYQSSSVFALKHFVVFRMCPTDSCDSGQGGCETNYGEYVVDVDTYLQAKTKHNLQQFEEMCNACEEYCNGDGNNNNNGNGNNNNYKGSSINCAGCTNQCNAYENLNQNGYVDATNYIECQQLEVEEADDDDDGAQGDDDGSGKIQLYIGPRCVKKNKYSSKTQIRIGLFTDENCWRPYEKESVADVLGYQIYYHMIKNSVSGSECISCREEEEEDSRDGDGDDEEEEARVLEVCDTIYDASAKCETKHGFTQGLARVYGYENQVQNERAVCTFVDSLVWNSYNEYGEIEINEVQDVYDRSATPLQKTMLTLLTCTIVGVAAYAHILHKEIENGYPSLRLRLGLIREDGGRSGEFA